MDVFFYTVTDDPRTINKTIPSAHVHLEDVRMKDDTNIIQPTLDIKFHVGLFACNYCYIEHFHRYYFIKNITTTENRLLVECEVDVLKSFESDIMNMKAFVVRQGKGSETDTTDLRDKVLANLLIPDDTLPVQANRKISIIGRNDPGNEFGNVFTPDSYSYVLLVNGGYATSQGGGS